MGDRGSGENEPIAFAHPDPSLWWRYASVVIVPALLVIIHFSRGLRGEYVIIAASFLALAWTGPRARRFSFLLLPLVLTGFAYDYFGLLLSLRGSIRVAELRNFDLQWFSVQTAAGRITWPEYFAVHHWTSLDLLCGFAYMIYMFETFGLVIYFYFVDRRRMQLITWGFLAINLLGMAVWLLYPAAPPWYLLQHGEGPAVLSATPSPAGTARFDELLGISYFNGFYARSTNVFGAMPSLHVGYPAMVVCAVWGLGWRWRTATIGFALWVAFSAVYLVHHYVADLLGGVVCALVAYGCVWRWRRSTHQQLSVSQSQR